MVTVVVEQPYVATLQISREFGGFGRDCRTLVVWLAELRLVLRYRRRLIAMHSAEVYRLHKVLNDGRIKLGGVVSGMFSVFASAMIKGLIEGRDVASLPGLVHGALGHKQHDLQAALLGIPADRREGSTRPYGRGPSR